MKALAHRSGGTLLTWGVLASTFCTFTEVLRAEPGQQQVAAESARQAHLLARRTATATQLHIDDESTLPAFDAVRVPPNLLVAAPLRQVLESMLRHSPTFRRQCARLSSASTLTIRLEQVARASPDGSRAVTNVSVDAAGRMLAHVQLGESADREEVLAHEFEHIIEQLDGVDLPSLARRSAAGVRVTQGTDRFETERAVAVGRQVAQEIRTAARTRM